MSHALVIADHVFGRLHPTTYECVTAATTLDYDVTVAVVGDGARVLAQAANVTGVREIVAVAAGGAEPPSDVRVDVGEALVRDLAPALVLCGFTANATGFAAALAVRCSLGFASDVVALRLEDERLIAEREIYGGKARAVLELPADRPSVVLLRAATWSPAEGAANAPTRELAVEVRPSRITHRAYQLPEGGGIDITKADLLLAIGRGVDDQSEIPMFEQLAEKMGAKLAASRPLVDAGWVSPDRQVGQSGKTVAPKLYLALGVSGASQHIAGMKDSGTIIAVNKDPHAPIFNVAHYGAVADIFEVAEELHRLWS